MRQLVVGAILTFNLDEMNASPEDYDIEEVIEMIRLDVEREYSPVDLSVEIRDYYVEEDGYTVDWS
jgi:hypothetical protein